ncbi:FadR/GntR family transcriptional regulator [Roseibium sp. M-1]
MNNKSTTTFELPDKTLTSLPTGAVKDTVEQLGRRIAHGDYKTGAVLPREDELVEEFGVSRTVVREAIKVLCGKGLVRTARRYGSRVCPFDDWNLLDPDVIRWHNPKSPQAARLYAEATELRIIFEPEAAALAAINASRAQREIIHAAANAIHPVDSSNDTMGADYAFHATILQASGNLMLAQLQNLIYAVLIFSYSDGCRDVSGDQISRRNHMGVADAIVSGDAETARSRMHAMLTQNKALADRIAASAKN